MDGGESQKMSTPTKGCSANYNDGVDRGVTIHG